VKHSKRTRRPRPECFTFGPFSFASILFYQFLGFGLVGVVWLGYAIIYILKNTYPYNLKG
jgi:hypothetical protein